MFRLKKKTKTKNKTHNISELFGLEYEEDSPQWSVDVSNKFFFDNLLFVWVIKLGKSFLNWLLEGFFYLFSWVYFAENN